MKFKCEKCGCEKMEEVMINVTQSSVIASVEDGCLEYGNISSDGGEVDRYQCVKCGEVIKDGRGMAITDPEKLEKWLKKNKIGEQKPVKRDKPRDKPSKTECTLIPCKFEEPVMSKKMKAKIRATADFQRHW